MPTKEFVVKVAACDADNWALMPSEVYARLSEAIGYNGAIWIENVAPYTKPGLSFTGKIPAIKHLRSIVEGMSLVEAKDVVDATTHLSKFRTHGGITVEYTADNGQYTITDNR